MDKTYASSFEDHYKFKSLIVLVDKQARDMPANAIKEMLQKALWKPSIVQEFLERLDKSLIEKLIPKHVALK